MRSFRLIRSGFTESMPANKSGLDAEGRRPAGNVIGHATIFGQRFSVWHGGTDFTFLLNHNETSGVTHILASLNWLINHRKIPASVTLAQVNFGWEIASTDGKAKDFTVTNYWLHTRRARISASRLAARLPSSWLPPIRRRSGPASRTTEGPR